MAERKGLYILKPDALLQDETEEVVTRMADEGIEIYDAQFVKWTKEDVHEFYGKTGHDIEDTWYGYYTQMASLAIIALGDERIHEQLLKIKKEMRLHPKYDHDFFYTGHHSSDSDEDFISETKILGLKHD